MAQQNSQASKNDRVKQILEMLLDGQPRDKIADQFGYSTWKSLDIYMRRRGYSWNSQRHVYVNTVSEPLVKEEPSVLSADSHQAEVNPTDINPEDVVRLFSIGILDAREIAKRTGFTGHKEMATYMLRHGYQWSSTSLNYINTNPAPPKLCLANITEESLIKTDEVYTSHALTGNVAIEKYLTLLEFLWQSRDNLIKIIESMNVEDKIQVYHVPGPAKTKSIYLSDGLTELMMTLCQKHSLSQKQGYEAALVEYLSKYGFQAGVDKLIEHQNER